MRFDIPNCPDCGDPAGSIIESVEVRSFLTNSNGQFHFDTTMSDVNWETQTPVQEAEGPDLYVYLGCSRYGNCWRSKGTELESAFAEDAATSEITS